MLDNKGYTVIESFIAALIFFAAVSAVLYVYSKEYSLYINNNSRIEVQENMRIALKKMYRGIRQAGSVISCSDTELILEPAPDDNVRGFRYDHAGKEVEVNVGGIYLPVASQITYLHFDYSTESRVVKITIKGQKGNSGVLEMSTSVQVRAD
jgi:Tfp pilus assembly protein PilW